MTRRVKITSVLIKTRKENFQMSSKGKIYNAHKLFVGII